MHDIRLAASHMPNGWQKQCDQNANDRDNDEQLNKLMHAEDSDSSHVSAPKTRRMRLSDR